MHQLTRAHAQELDPHTLAFHLEVPRNQIVLLQTFFELYDGVGTVRTLSGDRALLCIFTTPALVDDCIGVLNAIRDHVTWEVAENILDAQP